MAANPVESDGLARTRAQLQAAAALAEELGIDTDVVALAQVIATNSLASALQELLRPRRPAARPPAAPLLATRPPTANLVLIRKAAEMTGYTAKAIQAKIYGGIWIEGREWVRSPDGHLLIDMEGYRRWVESDVRRRRS